MVEQARKAQPDAGSWKGPSDSGREDQEIDQANLERALRDIIESGHDPSVQQLRASGDGDAARNLDAAARPRPVPTQERARASEWASSLDLVKEACESIRISEERVEALEQELEQLTMQSRDDLKRLLARYKESQEELKQANARAEASQVRATDAEAWLARLNEAIVEGFGRQGRASDPDNDH